jgi:hypothetical protein
MSQLQETSCNVLCMIHDLGRDASLPLGMTELLQRLGMKSRPTEAPIAAESSPAIFCLLLLESIPDETARRESEIRDAAIP